MIETANYDILKYQPESRQQSVHSQDSIEDNTIRYASRSGRFSLKDAFSQKFRGLKIQIWDCSRYDGDLLV